MSEEPMTLETMESSWFRAEILNDPGLSLYQGHLFFQLRKSGFLLIAHILERDLTSMRKNFELEKSDILKMIDQVRRYFENQPRTVSFTKRDIKLYKKTINYLQLISNTFKN